MLLTFAIQDKVNRTDQEKLQLNLNTLSLLLRNQMLATMRYDQIENPGRCK